MTRPGAGSVAKRMDIAFGVDGAFAPHLAALIASIVRYVPSDRFRFIILCGAFCTEDRARVEAVADKAQFLWIEISDADVPAWVATEHFSPAILYRLGLEALAPADCHRLLYFDADVVALGDVSHLHTMDLGPYPIGAVMDCFVDPDAFAKRWGLPTTHARYFNSGVMIIDLNRVRAEKLFTRAITFIQNHGRDLRFADQDALNHAVWGNWMAVPPAWNIQRHMAVPSLARTLGPEFDLQRQSARIVHFTGPEKPWVRAAYHPLAFAYWRALARTPFLREIADRERLRTGDILRMWGRWLKHRPQGLGFLG